MNMNVRPNLITFRNLSMQSNRIDVEAVNGAGSYPLWFQFDRDLTVSTNTFAVALSTLCGVKYDHIHFDFPVASEVVSGVASFTQAEVTSNGEATYEKPSGTNVSLSFSGGFDSLAAHRLLNGQANLVSTDFGGWFEREARFFEKFDPLVVSTNIRRTPSHKDSFARNHWTFMGLGAILTSEYLEAGFHVFGTILAHRFARKPPVTGVKPLEMVGMKSIPVTDGITEFGTAKILAQTDVNLIGDSLRSLAGNTDRKRLLKLILATVAAEELDVELPLPDIPKTWGDPVKFEASYTTALSILYLIAKGHANLIEQLYVIPQSAFEIVDGLSLDFIMKVNTDFYGSLPGSLAAQLAPRFIELGFRPYTEADWQEAKQVRSYLNQIFYPELV